MKCPACSSEMQAASGGYVSCEGCGFHHTASFAACVSLLADQGHDVSRWTQSKLGSLALRHEHQAETARRRVPGGTTK